MNKKSMIGVLPIILILAFLFTGMAYASQWARIFGDGYIASIKQTLDGGYIVAGSGSESRDARILKLNANGYFQ
jgi:hypothetical protein